MSAVTVAVAAADGAGAFETHHIQYLFHSYSVRDGGGVDRLVVVVVTVLRNVVFVV